MPKYNNLPQYDICFAFWKLPIPSSISSWLGILERPLIEKANAEGIMKPLNDNRTQIFNLK